MRRFLALALVGLAGCTSTSAPDPPPAEPTALAVAPRDDCPLPPLRGGHVPVEDVPRELGRHVPKWIPPGFGYSAASTGWDDVGIEVWWSSQRCAQFRVGFTPGSGNVREWSLQYDKARACGNAILGSKRCIGYEAHGLDGSLGVQTIGLSRATADRLVASIAL